MKQKKLFEVGARRKARSPCPRCGKMATLAAWRKSPCRLLTCRKPTWREWEPKPETVNQE